VFWFLCFGFWGLGEEFLDGIFVGFGGFLVGFIWGMWVLGVRLKNQRGRAGREKDRAPAAVEFFYGRTSYSGIV
jgi:hypothetical protein